MQLSVSMLLVIAINLRRFRVKLNADSIFGTQMDYLNQTKSSVNVPLTTLLNGLNTIEITNQSTRLSMIGW